MSKAKPDPKPAPVDHRSDAAAGLDATVEWLRERGVADRMPSGPASHVSPSSAAGAASELARRTRPTVGDRWEPSGLEHHFRQLPRQILDYQPDAHALQRTRDEIDRIREAPLFGVPNPPPPPPHYPGIEDVAKALGIRDLPVDRDEAARLVVRENEARWNGDRRAAGIFSGFMRELGSGHGGSIFARRARRLLVGVHLPPVAADDATYGRDDARNLWPELPRPAVFGSDVRRRVERLFHGERGSIAVALGISLDPPSNLPPVLSLDGEINKLQRQRDGDPRKRLVPFDPASVHGRDSIEKAARFYSADAANEAEYERRVDQIRAQHRASLRERQRVIEEHYDALRIRVLSAIACVLANLEPERGSLKWLYVRELYVTLLDDPSCQTVLASANGDKAEYAQLALDRARSLGAVIEVVP